MNYTEVCTKIVALSPSINDAFLIDSQARLLAFKIREDNDTLRVDESTFAERLEDLAFVANACKHHERFYDELEYIDINYKHRSSVIFPLGTDKILVICLKNREVNLHQLAIKISEVIHAKTQIIKE